MDSILFQIMNSNSNINIKKMWLIYYQSKFQIIMLKECSIHNKKQIMI